MKYFSVDIESLSLQPTAHVLSIGAVEFDIATGDIKRKFYAVLQGDMQGERHIDRRTVHWWIEQAINHPATAAFHGARPDATVMMDLGRFLDYANKRVFFLGSTFDAVALESLNKTVSSPYTLWGYRDVMDLRTLRTMLRDTGQDPFEGVEQLEAHDALNDAIVQAKAVTNAYKMLGLIA